MRLVLMSDTHGYHNQIEVPDGDVLIHAGDSTDDIGQQALREFLKWFQDKPHAHKILIAGNHDGAFEKWPDLTAQMLKEYAPSVTYLQDSGCEIDGIKFWGSPFTPSFMGWYFNRDRGDSIKHHWDKIPDGIDVLITHGPAFGRLDLSNNVNFLTGLKFDEHLGCDELAKAIERVRPKIHVFGHIHGSGGLWYQAKDVKMIDTIAVNASIMDEAYIPTHKPQIFYLP